jgi:hypothetical protein
MVLPVSQDDHREANIASTERGQIYLQLNSDNRHPLARKLQLMACRLSGQPWRVKEFHNRLKNSSSTPGGKVPRNNIRHTGTNGKSLVVNNLLIPFTYLWTMFWISYQNCTKMV